MRQHLRAMMLGLGVAAGLPLAAATAAAQVRGIPVYNNGVPRGIGIYGDVGLPNDEAGGGTAYAVTGRAGFGVLGVSAMLSSYNPDGPAGSDLSVGATASYRVFGVGGLFGYYGLFFRNELGIVHFYLRNKENPIMIDTVRHGRLLISPDSPSLLRALAVEEK